MSAVADSPPLPTQGMPGPAQAYSLLVLATLPVMASALLAPILPQLMRQFAGVRGSAWLVPMILTTPGICMVVFSPLAGVIGDRFGRRKLLLACLGVYGIVGMAPLALNDLYLILASRVLVGIAEGGVLTLSTALIGDYFKGAERDTWLGYQTAVAAVSAVLLIAVGGVLGEIGWRAPFALYGLTVFMLIAVWRVTWEPAEEAAPASALASGAKTATFPWRHIGSVMAVALIAAVMFYIVQLQAGVAFAASGVRSPALIGILIASATIAIPLATLVFGRVSQLPTSLLLLASFLLLTVGFLGIGLTNDYRILWAALCVAQLGCGMVLPTVIAWAVSGLPFAVRARGVGLQQGAFAVGQGVSVLLIALLIARTGSLAASLRAVSFLTLLMTLVCLAVWVFKGRPTHPFAGAPARRGVRSGAAGS